MIESWCRGVRPYILLALLALALDLPGIATIPVLDRDEARFAQATRQMIETGDYLRIRFQNEARNKKPAGIYWLQAASVRAFSDAASDAIWPYRLPSLIGAVAAVLLTFGLGQGLVGRRAALVGAGLLAATLELSVEAHIAKTDAVLLATAVAAQGALGLIYRAAREERPAPWRWALLFWVAQALAILLKGPVVPLLSLLTVAALSVADREARWLKGLRAWWGVPLLLVIAGPWFVAINIATGGAFMSEAVGHDLLGKLVGAQEAHGAPPLTHFLILLAGFWPATLFLGAVFVEGWRQRRDVAVRFLIAWAVPFWILVELVPTKLPQYLLPVYPALALMAGRVILAGTSGWRRHDLVFAAVWIVASCGILLGIILAPTRYGSGIAPIAIVAAIALAIVGALLLVYRTRAPAPALAIACSLIVFMPLGQIIAPRLDRLFVSDEIAGLVRQKLGAKAGHIASVGYSEPSLVFLLGTDTALLTPDAAAEALAQHRVTAAIVAAPQEPAFRRAWHGNPLHAEGTVSGLDYSTGKAVSLTLFTGE